MKKTKLLIIALLTLFTTSCSFIENILDKELTNQEKTEQVIEHNQYSVVKLIVQNNDHLNTLSAVIVHQTDNTYFALTNYLPLKDGRFIFGVELSDLTTYRASLHSYDPYSNLALVSFTAETSLNVMTLRDTPLSIDELVVSLGHHHNLRDYHTKDEFHITSLFSPTSTNLHYFGEGYLTHDFSINDGEIGGGLFDLNGDLVGINIHYLEDEETSQAVPLNIIKKVLPHLINQTPIEKEALLYEEAISVLTILNEPSSFPDYNIPSNITNGVYITNVLPNGVFHLTTLQAGDIIVKINDVDIINEHQMKNTYYYHVTDYSEAIFTIYRNNLELTLNYDASRYIHDYYSYKISSHSSGAIFEGEFFGEEKQGYAKTTYPNGYYTESYYQNNILEGLSITYTNDAIITRTFNNGSLSIPINITYSNGDYYEGDVVSDIPHGIGRMVYGNGDIYQGTFKGGKRDGFGELWYENGDHFIGTFLYNLKHGGGSITYIDGSEYHGEFSYDLYHGQGNYVYSSEHPSFRYLAGTFSYGLPTGSCQILLMNGILTANFIDWNNTTDGSLQNLDGSSTPMNLVDGVLIPD